MLVVSTEVSRKYSKSKFSSLAALIVFVDDSPPSYFSLASSPLSQLTRGDHPPTHDDANEAMYYVPQFVSTYCYCPSTIKFLILAGAEE